LYFKELPIQDTKMPQENNSITNNSISSFIIHGIQQEKRCLARKKTQSKTPNTNTFYVKFINNYSISESVSLSMKIEGEPTSNYYEMSDGDRR